MSKFFKSVTAGAKELELAAAEGVFSYHNISHCQSFRSMDCTLRIIQKLFEPKFSCARTYLDQANFVSVSLDSPNHKDLKMFPTLVRYFDPKSGVQVKLLELEVLPGETSEIICNHLTTVLQKTNIFG